jgi:hypothetical protein
VDAVREASNTTLFITKDLTGAATSRPGSNRASSPKSYVTALDRCEKRTTSRAQMKESIRLATCSVTSLANSFDSPALTSS